MEKLPIFIGWTKSFWFGIFPAVLAAIDIAFQLFGDPTTGVPIASSLAWLLSWFQIQVTSDQIAAIMMRLAPLYALIIAQQRSHASRPYTLDPRAIK